MLVPGLGIDDQVLGPLLGLEDHVLVNITGNHRRGLRIGVTWRIRLNDPCPAAMRPHVRILTPRVKRDK